MVLRVRESPHAEEANSRGEQDGRQTQGRRVVQADRPRREAFHGRGSKGQILAGEQLNSLRTIQCALANLRILLSHLGLLWLHSLP